MILVVALFSHFKFTIMKKNLKLLGKAAVLILLLSLNSCYYNEILEDISPPDIVNDVSFAIDIQPIFTTSCASCHPSTAPPDLTAGNSWIAIIDGDYVVPNDLGASPLYQRMIGNGNLMPPSGSLPASEINSVKNWIEQGVLDN